MSPIPPPVQISYPLNESFHLTCGSGYVIDGIRQPDFTVGEIWRNNMLAKKFTHGEHTPQMMIIRNRVSHCHRCKGERECDIWEDE